MLGIAPRFLRPFGANMSVPGFLLGQMILHPGHRNDEQGRQKEAKQDVDPGEPYVVRAHSETSPEGAKRTAKCLFHVDAPRKFRTGVKTFIAEYLSKVPTQSEAVEQVLGSIGQMPPGRWLLAVSGGRDSMVLLDAFSRRRPSAIAAVATYDHGTGTAATAAARLVERRALQLALPVVLGSLPAGTAAGEAAWRRARWKFLRGWAAELNARVVTAHTWNDQVETVVLRLLRDAGARGLAGMLAGTAGAAANHIARPFITVARASIEAYATRQQVEFVEDPSNATREFSRNRVRHEILPALERADPGFSRWCYDLSTRAAALRRGVAHWVDDALTPTVSDSGREVATSLERVRSVGVRAAPLSALDPHTAAVVWPEVAARVGLAMDRRGIARVAAWAPSAVVGGRIQLAGGAEIFRTHSAFVLRFLY